MPTIVPSPSEPAPVTCLPWCVGTTDHPHATLVVTAHALDQACRSTVHRVDAPLGGGHAGNRTTIAAAGLYLQAEQRPCEPATYVLGLELGGSEYWTRLRIADLRTFVTAARTLLSQSAAA